LKRAFLFPGIWMEIDFLGEEQGKQFTKLRKIIRTGLPDDQSVVIIA